MLSCSRPARGAEGLIITPAIDFSHSLLAVGDTALTGRHRADQAIRWYEILQRFNDPHRALRIGDHYAYELFSGHVSDIHVFVIRGGSSAHEQHVEHPARQSAVRVGNLVPLVDIKGLDLHPAFVIFRQPVQLGPGSGSYRTDDIPSLL